MTDVFKLVEEFHQAFQVPIQRVLSVPNLDRRVLRRRLIIEENQELHNALHTDNLLLIADALADLIVVVVGTALEYGIPLAKVFEEVHRSNMTKLDEDGLPILRDDGKIMKPVTFSPPDIAGVLKGGI